MNDKRVLILVAADSAEDNGITVRGTAVLEALKDDYRVRTYSSGSWYSASVPVLLAGYIAWAIKLLYLIPRQRVDCVYCCADYFGFISAWIVSRMRGFPVVFEAHGIMSEENKAKKRPDALIRTLSLIERFVIRRADYVIALSRDILEFYRTFNAHIEVIPVLLDETAYRKRSRRMPSRKTIGLVGPFDMPANKYYLTFLAEHIDDFDPRIRFRVIGKCVDRIASSRVTYTGYISSRDEYIAELASLDALLVPASLSTSGPLNKILEAMASSLPVFVTPVGAYGLDYAEDGKNIIIADRSELAARVNQVIFDEVQSSLIGANARATVEERYSKTGNSVALRRIISALVGER
ncbi:MAG: glycosyltransferase [Halobacteriota archaeon]